MKVIGSFVSPYVRKVLACMNLKGLDYEVDPITPFFGNDEYEQVSPLRRIPVLIDGDFSICDSSVVCAYLDDAYPQRPLLPGGEGLRQRRAYVVERDELVAAIDAPVEMIGRTNHEMTRRTPHHVA